MPRHFSSHRLLCWRLTGHCNRSCAFCLSRSGPRISHPEIDAASVAARLRELGVEKISYSGGEPLGFPDLEGLILLVDRLGMAQLLTTNGDALARHVPGWISRLEYLKLSFYGNAELHDSLMGEGHYLEQMELALRLKERHGVIVGVNFMLTPRSLATVPQFLADCKCAAIDNVMFQTYIFSRRRKVDRLHEFNLDVVRLEEIGAMASAFAGVFQGGIKVHDYAIQDWFMVLTPEAMLTLPSSSSAQDIVMGSIFEDILQTPDGERDAPVALETLWRRRSETTAIVVLDDGVVRDVRGQAAAMLQLKE